jgi:hypothetical protein
MDSLDLVALDFLVGAIDRFLDGNVSGSLDELKGGFGRDKIKLPRW